MNDELERLREVVRALVAERRADKEWSETLDLRREKKFQPTEESVREMRRLADIAFNCRKETDIALAMLAELGTESRTDQRMKENGPG
jgi:hypothetical protein